MAGELLKTSYRILFEPEMEESLLALKQTTRVTIAEHVRRAIRFYLLFRGADGRIPDLAITEFWAEWKCREAEKARLAEMKP